MLCLLSTENVFLSYKYRPTNGSEILDQLTNLEKGIDSEVTKPKRGRKKKINPKINEVDESDVREKRERLVACVLSGNSKQYLGKEYTEQQINEMDCTNVNIYTLK